MVRTVVSSTLISATRTSAGFAFGLRLFITSRISRVENSFSLVEAADAPCLLARTVAANRLSRVLSDVCFATSVKSVVRLSPSEAACGVLFVAASHQLLSAMASATLGFSVRISAMFLAGDAGIVSVVCLCCGFLFG